ncbi:putative glycoside hydrolase subgroup catalytic core protein [Neofusicoccum parvum]|uniref:Putative glycoside hydrolase subgroup catalytic core protein n=1 Tax=Botryosphaeria parva (strain UCR-NP2) TaxID=1287680 RepID=R1G7J5_BOTPV|nr:putative glycoside hydrolase subgroup catalytic core protein [Neofusicoccum parvum UCRNP2]GME40785.1 putative glycoside hydrolase subgroup catalytic core protein [Neofusicoccum parvum]
MQYRLNSLALLALAGSAIAHQPHQHKHAKLHERRLAQAEAPYAFGNGTVNAAGVAAPSGGAPAPPQDSTSTLVLTQTVHATQYQTQSVAGAPAATPVEAAEVGAESVAASSAALTTTAEVCDEVTVTVTNAPVTVTVTAAAGGEASSAAPSSAAPSSAAPVAPSSFVLPGSSSTIEVSTSAAPVATSSAVYVAPSSAAPVVESSVAAEATSSSVYVAPSSAAVETSSVAPTTTVAPSSTVAPTTSSTSSSAAATSSSAGVTGVVDKRGLVYNTFSVVEQFTSSQVSWGWNWAQQPGGDMPSGMEFVPILWGNRETDDLANWKSNAEEQIGLGSQHLMGFNEPDVDTAGGGSNMDASTAASVYKEYMNTFADKATLISPGVCNGEGLRESTGRNQGLDWLQDFYDACGGFTSSGCKVDKINIHWYSSYQGDLDSIISYFKEYVEKAHTKFGMNLWITEYQLQNADDATQQEFVSQTSEWMSSQTYIERYSYFKAETIVASSSLLAAYTS